MSEILHQLDQMTQARRARLIAARGNVPDVIWLVLFGGAAVTVVFTYFFGSKNLRAQTLMTGLVALLIFAELLIVIAIDRPFTGAAAVTPDALTAVPGDFRFRRRRRRRHGATGPSATAINASALSLSALS